MTTNTEQIARRANHPTLKTGDPIVIAQGARWSQGSQPVDQAKDGTVTGKAGSVSSSPGASVFVDNDGDILVHFDSTGPSTYCSVEYITPDTGRVSDPEYAIDTAVCTTDGAKAWRISLTADRTQVRIKDQLSEVDPMLVTFDAAMPAILEPVFRFTDKDSTGDILARVEAIKHAVGFMAARDRHMDAARNAVAQHREDIVKIGESLIEEAINRDWCDEFDQWVTGINRGLNISLPECPSSWSVSGTAEVTLTVYVPVRATIEGRERPDESDIESALRDNLTSYDVSEAMADIDLFDNVDWSDMDSEQD
jgi:hypothetical protein